MFKVDMVKEKMDITVKKFLNRNEAYSYINFKNQQAFKNGDSERYFVISA